MNCYSSGCRYQENPKTEITFGPAGQEKKVAALYAQVTKPPASDDAIPNDGASLESRIFAESEAGVVDLRFTCFIKNKILTCRVQNSASVRQQFAVAQLSDVLKDLERRGEVRWMRDWTHRPDNRTFDAPPDDKTEYKVRIRSKMRFVEKVVPFHVFADDMTPLASGQVSVYLPEVKR